jgi:hypothetical protein
MPPQNGNFLLTRVRLALFSHTFSPLYLSGRTLSPFSAEAGHLRLRVGMRDDRGQMRAVVGNNQPLSRCIDVTEVAQLDSEQVSRFFV